MTAAFSAAKNIDHVVHPPWIRHWARLVTWLWRMQRSS